MVGAKTALSRRASFHLLGREEVRAAREAGQLSGRGERVGRVKLAVATAAGADRTFQPRRCRIVARVGHAGPPTVKIHSVAVEVRAVIDFDLIVHIVMTELVRERIASMWRHGVPSLAARVAGNDGGASVARVSTLSSSVIATGVFGQGSLSAKGLSTALLMSKNTHVQYGEKPR